MATSKKTAPKKVAKKKVKKDEFKLLRSLMSEAGYTKEEIADKIYEIKKLRGWEPITFAELWEIKDNEKELKKLYSVCWKDGSWRCDCKGITELVIMKSGKKITGIEWSDADGDPSVWTNFKLSDKIDKISDDGQWAYSLYKKTA
jgi:hypothetical protein